MTAIWHLLSPTGFPNEATLQTLVEKAPHLLPLAGTPCLIVVGREVQLGSGRADLIAIEPTGQVTIIEIKLARNAEARRAVIAQVLAYAAYLWGMEQTTLEQVVLSQHLHARGFKSLADAIESNDQEGSFDAGTFSAGIAESLKLGQFRLVFVLDEAPDELMRLSSYLETMSDQLIIDLISLSAYTVNGSQILVPQRFEALPRKMETSPLTALLSKTEGRLVDGAGDFIASIETAPETSRPLLQRLSNWAVDLERERLVKLKTYHGKSGILTLLPRLEADDAGLVSIYNNHGVGYLCFWWTVFERRAQMSLAQIESNTQIKQGNSIREVSVELLNALTMAYQEAVGGVIEV